MTTGLVGKPPRAARQVMRSTDLRAGLTGGLVSAGESRWRPGRAAPAARRWQTGLGSALSGGPVPTRRARSATGAAAGRLAHQPLSQPAGYRPPGGVALVGRPTRIGEHP